MKRDLQKELEGLLTRHRDGRGLGSLIDRLFKSNINVDDASLLHTTLRVLYRHGFVARLAAHLNNVELDFSSCAMVMATLTFSSLSDSSSWSTCDCV